MAKLILRLFSLALSLSVCFGSPASFPPPPLLASFSSALTLQRLPFCFSLNFRHNYRVIAGDRESVVVDASLSFLTDTQPSALLNVAVYPSHLPLLSSPALPPSQQHFATRAGERGREIRLHRYRRQHTSVLGARLAYGGHVKTEARGDAALQ